MHDADAKGYLPGYGRIGSILISEGKINESQLQEALRRQEQRGERLGRVLVEMKAISEEDLLRTLLSYLGRLNRIRQSMM